ncbi:alpha/beta fold hydrolase [Streptomyces sp. NPDC090106]|uniref:alpha/beta fold hydrolase n=1 Tax=Streptomyces sp. NPDC090106 TaxID=3365946 RepID=UPI00381DE340
MTLAADGARTRLQVGPVTLAYRRYGRGDAPAVLLLHGAAAHSGWWDEVAPLLASTHHVVAADLSGHGDSSHRSAYSAETWSAEVAAILGATTDGPAVVVGHSMGGLVAIAAAARSPRLVSSLVLVDTRLPLSGLPTPTRPPRLFRSDTEALDRFRLLPEHTNADPRLLRRLARDGLRRTPDGWRWKFDPSARRRFTNDGVREDLKRVRCPVAYIHGARSDMGGPDSRRRLEQWLGRPVAAAVVPDAFHHVPLDQPTACAATVNSFLGSPEQEH